MKEKSVKNKSVNKKVQSKNIWQYSIITVYVHTSKYTERKEKRIKTKQLELNK